MQHHRAHSSFLPFLICNFLVWHWETRLSLSSIYLFEQLFLCIQFLSVMLLYPICMPLSLTLGSNMLCKVITVTGPFPKQIFCSLHSDFNTSYQMATTILGQMLSSNCLASDPLSGLSPNGIPSPSFLSLDNQQSVVLLSHGNTHLTLLGC